MGNDNVLWRGTASGVSSPAAETAILTSGTFNVGRVLAAQPVRISGTVDVTEGTTGTAFVIRCRQGNGVGGTQVGQALTQTNAATNSETGAFSFEDATGYPLQPGAQYTITIAETGATVAGTVVAIEFQIEQ